jgi:hypothetical protein
LSGLTRPDIFIIGHRQAGGMRLSIARAMGLPLHRASTGGLATLFTGGHPGRAHQRRTGTTALPGA